MNKFVRGLLTLALHHYVATFLFSAERVQELLQGRLGVVGRTVGELVGLMVLKLAHDLILPLDVTCYSTAALRLSAQLNQLSAELQVQTPHFKKPQ